MEYMSLYGNVRNTPSDTTAWRTPAESRQEYLTTSKEYIEPCKTRWDKELGEKTGVLAELDLPRAGGATETGIQFAKGGN